ncbi:hypothetical protein CR513_06619, partial [Mucuna pruriens]
MQLPTSLNKLGRPTLEMPAQRRHSKLMHFALEAPRVQQHPFVDGIMETPLPKGWRGMHLDKYNNTTDLDEHLTNYLTQVNLFNNEYVILCRTNGKKGKSERLIREPMYQVFTPFNTSWVTLFEEICSVDLITFPSQRRLAHGTDKIKYYCYYRNYNHSIEGCLMLRDKIEELIQAGHLQKFVKRGADYGYMGQKQDVDERRRERPPRKEWMPRQE